METIAAAAVFTFVVADSLKGLSVGTFAELIVTVRKYQAELTPEKARAATEELASHTILGVDNLPVGAFDADALWVFAAGGKPAEQANPLAFLAPPPPKRRKPRRRLGARAATGPARQADIGDEERRTVTSAAIAQAKIRDRRQAGDRGDRDKPAHAHGDHCRAGHAADRRRPMAAAVS